MPYDYYEYFKNQIQNEEFTESSELVRKNLWNETVDFNLSQKWIKIEDRIFITLYIILRYT